MTEEDDAINYQHIQSGIAVNHARHARIKSILEQAAPHGKL